MSDIPRTPPHANPPSPYMVEQAVSAWQQARARILAEDPNLENDEAQLVDLLGPEEGEINDILSRLIDAALHADSMQSAAKERIAQMEHRLERYENRSARLRSTALAIMDATGLKRFERGHVTASVRSGIASSRVVNQDVLPPKYLRTVTTTSIDKRTLLQDLKALEPGKTIPGAELNNGAPALILKVQ